MPNTTWHYGWSGPQDGSHTELSYLYDTLIAGNNCNKIYFDDVVCSIGWAAESTGRLYTYTQNGVTYIKRFSGNQFDTLFCFNAPIGTKWRRSPTVSTDCSLSYMEVTDSGHVVLQGKNIKWQQVYYETHYPIFPTGSAIDSGSDTLFERIGSKTNCSLIMGTHCTSDPSPAKLRCFSDAQLNLTFSAETCNYCGTSVGLREQEGKERLKIYPNPASSIINVLGEQSDPENSFVSISNTIGQTVMNLLYHKTIDISSLAPGYYILTIHKDGEMLHAKFLKN